MGTTAFGPWRFGLRLDYQLGDLSRLRDPRSRSEMLDYRLAPSLTYSIGHSTLGLEGHYRRYKEKIPDITTVQTDPNLKYYTMTGMENANGVVGGYNGYMREYVDHEFGFRLSCAWQSPSWSSLTEAGIDRGSEGVYGTYKYQPGHYHSYRYAIANKTTWRTPRWLHVVHARLQYEEGYADEYRQHLTTQWPVISSNLCATAGSRRCPISIASLLSIGPSIPTFLLQSLYAVSKWFTPMIVPTSEDPMPLALSSSHSSFVSDGPFVNICRFIDSVLFVFR